MGRGCRVRKWDVIRICIILLLEAAVLPITTAGENTGTNIPITGVPVESGKNADIGGASVEIYIGSGLFSSGTTINIKIHSAAGMDYIRLVKLS